MRRALSIALLQSFDSLFSAARLEDLSLNRSDSKRELVAQGCGTLLSGSFGFLGGSGSMVRTMPSYLAGGRTAWSGLASSVFMLAAVVLLAPVVKGIPIVLVASVLFVVAIELFDKWTLGLLKSLRTNGLATQRSIAVDLAIIALVVGTGLVVIGYAAVLGRVCVPIGVGVRVGVRIGV